MATTSKFDLSSDSPDRPVYGGGQRNLNSAAQMDRSSSFRESMQNPILSSLPNMSRSSSVAQGDVMDFFQCLRFDPKVVAADQKLSRQGDFKRLVSAAMGISADDSAVSYRGKVLPTPSPEEIKRIRSSLRESIVKGRDRIKIFSEALSVFNKFFPSIPFKKRSRSESHCSGTLLSSDRSMPTTSKMNSQNRAVNGGFELEQHKSEEQTKLTVPNKRTRTSLVDIRSNALGRTSGVVEKDREKLKLANSGIDGDDRSLSIGIDGWEKTKLKKRRSGIKPEASSNAVSNKLAYGYRELKQGMQHRPVADARSRLNNDLQTRENTHDDFNTASPTSSTKINAGVRAPRSGSGLVPKSSLAAQRATTPSDWDITSCSNKPPVVGVNHRRRSASTRSSSPPVAHWAGQRPHKISRTARRTNLAPIVPNNEESPLDSISDVSGNDPGLGFARRMTADSPQQVKMKGDHISSAVLSESEESGASEIKSVDKSEKADETDEKVGQNIQKVSTLSQQSRKNKMIDREELGDGIWRQGRSGRVLISTRSLMPMPVEKHGNVGTGKQRKSARSGLEKNESRPGRPPTRKLSDRKACARQKHTTANTASDILVGSGNWHEELLAAATFAINPDHALSSSFWKQMESYFRFLTDSDISLLKQPGISDLTPPLPASCPYTNSVSIGPIGKCLTENERPLGPAAAKECVGLSENLMLGSIGISLYQRLLAAIIPDEDCSHVNGDMELDAYWTEFELDQELEFNGSNLHDNYQVSGHPTFSGYRVTGGPEYHEAEIDALAASSLNIGSKSGGFVNGMLSNQTVVSGSVCSDDIYDNMEINEKIRLELQSIGIFTEETSEMSMEDDEISKEICKLEENYRGQVAQKLCVMDKLIKLASEAKEHQEKEFEQRAYDKLITIADKKTLTCRPANSSSGKSSANKIAKQAALAFVRQTLGHCHKFEDRGESCFSEPIFRDMFCSGTDFVSASQSVDAFMDESGRISGTMASQPSPRTSLSGQSGDGRAPFSSGLLPSVNHLTEQNTCKEDGWSNRVKKKEILIDDVIGGSLSNNPKGKRSERDREGKGHGRELLSRDGTNKTGRPTLPSAKGERKSRTKPKHKTTQLSASVNGLIGKIPEQPKSTLHYEVKSTDANNPKDGFGFDDTGPLDLSHLELPEMEVLGGDQEGDLGSWLNFDDDGLQDHGDFMGLEIPMDDLSDLNMMV